LKKISHLVATTFFTGHSPVAPGTMGSIVGALVYFFFPEVRGNVLFLLVLFFFFVGVWAAKIVEKRYGHDASIINVDELVGVWIAYLFIPDANVFFITACGFILFRIFDIVKPPPVNKSQNLPHGWGVMMDDVLAGIYANIVLRLLILLIF